jgi:hypothetical protein
MFRRLRVGWVMPLLATGGVLGLAMCLPAVPGPSPAVAAPPSQPSPAPAGKSEAPKAGPEAAGPECVGMDRFFAEEVWAKVGEHTCLNCHNVAGDASASRFLLEPATHDAAALARNRAAFEKMATTLSEGKPRLLAKAAGGLRHGGGKVLKSDSTGLRVLERFVARLRGETDPVAPSDFVPGPYFSGVAMASPDVLLRRVTLSLAGRLPTASEREAVAKNGDAALPSILDAVMREEAFYERLKEGFNDIFLTLGYPGNAPDALSYDHFEKTRHWDGKFDLGHVPEKVRQKARYELSGTYYKALLREPLELVAYIVRNERPFTEILTADYMMVSPYTARGYGIYDQVRPKFTNLDDPFEYVPARLPALKGRNGKVQPTKTGFYPHAGILSTFQYLRRYPTTVTNRNRLRARMYYQHFLGVDVMALAPRVTDAAGIAKKFEIPTLQAADCVVCHKVIDPIAGTFQDYFNEEGHYGPRKEGWFKDMFAPGREGTDLPEEERWRALQWLAEGTVKDPRFAVAMVEHVYYILLGRRPMPAPQDIDDPYFTPRRRAYLEQRKAIDDIAGKFAASGFNLKVAFKELIASPFYRVDGLAEAAAHPARRAELDDIGVTRMLTPEQLERKISAVFARKWGRLSDSDAKFAILYGGIDSKEVTQRNTEPSGAMGAIQRIMANDVACRNVAYDFSLPPAERRLFPAVEPADVPGSSPEVDRKIRAAIVRLHAHALGRSLPADHPDIERTWKLFSGIVADAAGRKGLERQEKWSCGAEPNKVPPAADPHYTIRAWRAVVTYLLRRDEFLYE